MSAKVFDAQAALGFVTSQTTYIEKEVYDIVYSQIQYPQLIPVDTSANAFAKSVTYFSQNQYGEARFINGNADDIPLAGTEKSKFETSVYSAGIGYAYGWEEINQAMMLDTPLSSDDAAAARLASEQMIDRIAFQGDTAKNFEGLFNSTAVTASAAATGNWATATPDQILADINNVLIGVATATNNTSMADTLLLPYDKMQLLSSTRLTDTGDSILTFLRTNNVYTAATGQALDFFGVDGLSTAGVGGEARMVAYRRDPTVLKLHMPMAHNFLPVFQEAPLRFVVPGMMRLGGLDIRLPNEVRYSDGI